MISPVRRAPCAYGDGALRSGRSKLRGVTLIETMVAVLLVSLGLLGLVALQATVVRAAIGAEDGQRAAILANELASKMWASRTVLLPAPLVQAWQEIVADPARGGLPSGRGQVTLANNVASIEITWRPPQAKAAEPAHRYVAQVLIP